MKKEVFFVPLNASDKELNKLYDLLVASGKRQTSKARTLPIRRKKSE